ncbi:MAG: BCCT family transporter [Gammaproteobacteria bacterium]|nr:MAG: BCCT family transporter [Gammaproteobacteria bacterium]
MEQSKTDWINFGACVAIIFLVCLPLALSPDTSGKLMQSMYDFIANELGILYLLAGVGCIGLLIWIASSRFGAVKLGDADESPEFSTPSWVAMLFCAGVGAGLMYWCGIEWSFYYQSPPFGVEPRSAAAAEWASTYGMYHWGFSAWAFYCLPTIAIAYPYYVKKLPYLRFSSSCHYFLKGREHGAVSRGIDFLFMIALIGGAASSLGFSSPMIAALLARLFDIPLSFGLEFAVVILCVVLFACSVWLGLKKGIKRLSDANLLLAFSLLIFVLIAGPTLFLLKTSINSVGLLAQNFVRMSFWTDPLSDSGFVESWTIFYWAWWIAFAPYVGLFVTRISRGRTIRQVIVGMLVLGSLGGWVFYMILGNYSMYLELEGVVAVSEIIESQSGNQAIIAILDQLPVSTVAIAVFSLVALIFSATTYDSASYALASVATLFLKAGDDPARWHRVFWAFALGLLPITFMFIGGIKVLQTTLLVVSLPILVVGVVMSVSLVKSLREDYPATKDLQD